MSSEGTADDTDGDEDPFEDYSSLAGDAPFDKKPAEYTAIERRAEIYGMIEDAGHPANLEKNQSQLADRYGVSQPLISRDMKKLREYEASHNSRRAKTVMGLLSEKAVTKHVDAAKNLEEAGRMEAAADRWERAMATHQEYVEYLFDTGDLESSPDTLEIEGDAGDVYMTMLREANEKRKDESVGGPSSR